MKLLSWNWIKTTFTSTLSSFTISKGLKKYYSVIPINNMIFYTWKLYKMCFTWSWIPFFDLLDSREKFIKGTLTKYVCIICRSMYFKVLFWKSPHHTCRKLGSWSRGDQVFWSHLLDPGAKRVDSGAIRVDSGALRGDPGAKRGSYRAIKNRLEVKVILNGII